MPVPSPGESISEVEIAQWLVEDGDYVEKDQTIAEVDSDKATLDLPAQESGTITLKAWGIIIRRKVLLFVIPVANEASVCPLCIAVIPALTISAPYAPKFKPRATTPAVKASSDIPKKGNT